MKKLVKFLTVAAVAVLMTAVVTGCSKEKKETTPDPEKKATKTITFGTNAEFPPFEYISTKNGLIDKYDGIDIAILKQIAEDNNVEVKIENMEFDSLLVALKNGQLDAVISGMTIKPERLEEVDFSNPYYLAKQVMIVKEDSTIAKAADMADKKIVVIQGYTGESCVKDLGYPYEAFKKGTEAVMELTNGKCDVVVIDSATAAAYVKDTEGLKIVEDDATFASEEYGIAVKKGDTETLDLINKTVDKMLKDGSINELSKKYSENEE